MELYGYPFKIGGSQGHYYANFDSEKGFHSDVVNKIKEHLKIFYWDEILNEYKYKDHCSRKYCIFPEFDTIDHLLHFILFLKKKDITDFSFVNLKLFV